MEEWSPHTGALVVVAKNWVVVVPADEAVCIEEREDDRTLRSPNGGLDAAIEWLANDDGLDGWEGCVQWGTTKPGRVTAAAWINQMGPKMQA